jgi:hypothetical protein
VFSSAFVSPSVLAPTSAISREGALTDRTDHVVTSFYGSSSSTGSSSLDSSSLLSSVPLSSTFPGSEGFLSSPCPSSVLSLFISMTASYTPFMNIICFIQMTSRVMCTLSVFGFHMRYTSPS